MIKILLVGLWVCALTLGGVYAAVSFSGKPGENAEAKAETPTEYVAGEILSLPVVTDNAVTGYFLAKVSVTVDSEKAKKVHLPIAPYITDQLFGLLVGDKLIDLPTAGSFDVAGLKTKVKDGINGQVGEELVTGVIVEQLDFLSKADLNSGDPKRRSSTIKIAEGEKPPVSAKAEGASH